MIKGHGVSLEIYHYYQSLLCNTTTILIIHKKTSIEHDTKPCVLYFQNFKSSVRGFNSLL